ncbi:hypothetical protein LRAMOSA07159 [Lichtheimia ramosa]|uniref:NTF2 domain-containing protein n=1 Tax=Lichtheimia ramosa TaxID=688394 RepID=A0A077WC69_9FUNG|nr:hypothetical protein LRAMOSA07159 [Lichtheimia ramosa]
MATDQSTTASTTTNAATNNAPKGLLGMFGGVLPSTPSGSSTILKPISSQKNNKAADNKATTLPQQQRAGGGAMKKSTMKGERRRNQSLISLAQRPGKVVTITPSAEPAEKFDSEDVTMGGMGKKKKTRKRFSPYNSQARARFQKQAAVTAEPKERVDILISGYIPGSEPNVIAYLQQKSKKTWEPVDVKLDQGQMLLTVDGVAVANAISRLNGYVFGNGPLNISWYYANGSSTVVPPTVQKSTTMDYIREFLRSRWDGEKQLLNLENMGADPILKNHAIRPPGDSRANEFVGPAMMKLAGEMFPNTVSITFARNTLKNLQSISTMTQFLPHIQNLSLEENRITSLAALDAISGPGKFKHLRELVLQGNPVCEKELKQGQERGYIKNVLKRFPAIAVLDGKPVDIAAQDAQALLKKQKMPVLTKMTFFDSEQSQTAAFDFLTKFFHLFDTNRPSLRAMYDESATFSVCALLTLQKKSTNTKVRGRRKQRMMEEDEAEATWSDLSRNLKKGKSSKKMGKYLSIGPDAIVSALQRLPSTMHDLSRSEDFVLDAFQQRAEQANLLQISLHGEFRSGNDETLYSFDRNMLIREAPPNSSAISLGIPYHIVSDMLCVRDYCSMLNRIGAD